MRTNTYINTTTKALWSDFTRHLPMARHFFWQELVGHFPTWFLYYIKWFLII